MFMFIIWQNKDDEFKLLQNFKFQQQKMEVVSVERLVKYLLIKILKQQ